MYLKSIVLLAIVACAYSQITYLLAPDPVTSKADAKVWKKGCSVFGGKGLKVAKEEICLAILETDYNVTSTSCKDGQKVLKGTSKTDAKAMKKIFKTEAKKAKDLAKAAKKECKTLTKALGKEVKNGPVNVTTHASYKPLPVDVANAGLYLGEASSYVTATSSAA